MRADYPIIIRTSIKELNYSRILNEKNHKIVLNNGQEIELLDIIATIINKNSGIVGTSYLLDDGEDQIICRDFTNSFNFDVGKLVHVIARPSHESGNIFIISQIMKLIKNSQEIELRKLQQKYIQKVIKTQDFKKTNKQIFTEKVKQNETFENKTQENNKKNNSKNIIEVIRILDNGTGADYDEVLTKTNDSSGEHIESLLRRGDIFEIRPGRLKVID